MATKSINVVLFLDDIANVQGEVRQRTKVLRYETWILALGMGIDVFVLV